jgi:hypothetical protein
MAQQFCFCIFSYSGLGRPGLLSPFLPVFSLALFFDGPVCCGIICVD